MHTSKNRLVAKKTLLLGLVAFAALGYGLLTASATTLLSDDFTGTTINTSKWSEVDPGGSGGTAGNIQQNGSLSLSGGGTWGQYYLQSQSTFDRTAGDMSMDIDVTLADCASGGVPGLGYGDPGVLTGGGQSYTVYYYGGVLYLSRQNANSNAENVSTGFGCTNNVPFHLKLTVASTTGAALYVNNSGTAAATLTGGTFNNKSFFLEGYQGTTVVDNFVLTGTSSATAPDAPTGLSATPASTQMTLGWTAPASNGAAITDYQIEYKVSATSTWSTFADGTSTATTTIVTGLTNGVGYDFRVSAINSVGTSTPSSVATGTPALNVPTAPLSLVGADGQSTEVPLTWSVPLSNGGASITDYLIEYKTVSTSTWSTFADGVSTVTGTIVTGLTNGTSYNFRVSAINSVGTSSASGVVTSTPYFATVADSFTGTTIDTNKWTEVDPGGIGGTVGNVQQNGSLSIVPTAGTWSAQNGVYTARTFDRTNGDVSMEFKVARDTCGSGVGPVAAGYGDMNFTTGGSDSYIFISNTSNWEIYYWSGGSNQSGSPQTLSGLSSCTNGVATTFKIVALQAGGAKVYVNGSGTAAATIAGGTFTNKTFWFGGLNAAGTVAYDDVVIIEPATGPYAPTSLTPTPGSGQVALSWTSGGDNGAAISDYVVEYKPTSTSTWSTFADGVSATTAATVTGLTNGVNYNFRVSAVNANGTSTPSSSATSRPVSSTPTAPTASSVSISGSVSVGEVISGTYTFTDVNGDSEATSLYRWLRADTAGGSYAAIAGATSVNYTVSSTDLGKYLKFEVTPVANASPTTGSAVLSAASTQVAEIDYINMILSTGQSLSVGVNSSPARTTTQPYSNLQLSGGNGGLGTGSSFTPLIESGVETISSAMANTITANDPGNDFDVAVGLHGVSGYTYSQLKKGTGPFSTGMTQVTNAKSAATALGRILRVIGVTTIHGETDNFNGVSGPTYQGYLEEWQHDYETDTKAITGQTGTIPLFLDQMSSFMSSYANTPTSEIPIYQLKAAEDNPGKIVMVAPKYFFNYSDRHHLTAASSQWLGEYYGKVMKKVVEDHESWRPLTPDTVTRSGNVIYANFHVPAGNLAFDTTLVSARTNYGFEYADSSSSASISSVQILDGDTVKVTLSTTPTGTNQRLRYAYTGVAGTDTGAQNAGSAAGNLRDTDSYPSLYGNTLYNWAVHFDAPITLDASAPVISAVTTSSVTTSSAVVSWTTDEVADSQIEYGLTGTLTASSSYSATLETSHTRSLTGLLACTTYNFRVRSYDATANLGTSANGTFTTTCTGSAPVVAATTTQITTASGGSSSLTNNGHTVTITVPTGFSAGDAYFQMQQVNASPVTGVASTPSGLSVAGSYLYHLSALSNPTTTLSSFNQPITVTLSYDPADISGLNESNLVIYRYDGSSWHLLTGCSVNTGAHTVTCTTTAFSYFGIFAAAQSSGYSPAQRDARSGSSQPVTTTTVPVATTTTSTVVAVPVFTRDLTLGSTGEDVRQLQAWLNAHGFTVAKTGAGSAGSESTLFGPATRAALKAFQTSKGITPASGYFGPLTRAALGGSVAVAPVTPTAPVATATFTRNLTVGVVGEDVRQLQVWLNAHGFVVAPSGPGSPGSETTKFGGATRAALKAFQTSKGITPASGYFGPLTRASLQ